MSQDQDGSRALTEPTDARLLNEDAMSDKKCSAFLYDSASEADCDSPKATVRVGLRGGRNRQYTLAAKLAARTIKRPSGCWEIQGCKANQAGHVHLSVGSPRTKPYVRVFAHRFAWEQANGRTIPTGMVVMHACDNPRCVNPAHLSIGTQAQNIHDSIRKGRYNVFGRQKLNAEQVLQIRDLAARGVLQKDIARQFGIARNTVSGIVHRKSWDHLHADDSAVHSSARP